MAPGVREASLFTRVCARLTVGGEAVVLSGPRQPGQGAGQEAEEEPGDGPDHGDPSLHHLATLSQSLLQSSLDWQNLKRETLELQYRSPDNLSLSEADDLTMP